MSAVPGPWEIEVGATQITAYIYPQTPKSERGHRLLIAQVPLGVDVEDRAEREANAQLVAAAPELVEALDDLVACAEMMPEFMPSINSDWYGVLINAKNALAKAEGRS